MKSQINHYALHKRSIKSYPDKQSWKSPFESPKNKFRNFKNLVIGF